MNSQSALELLDSIDQTISEIDGISGFSTSFDSYFAKFLVVYISGIFEEAVENIVIDFTERNTSRVEIITYIENNMKNHFRNPSFPNLMKLVGLFGGEKWKNELRESAFGGVALDSIVNNKNALAHGQLSTFTLADVKQYYRDSRPVIEKIDSLFCDIKKN